MLQVQKQKILAANGVRVESQTQFPIAIDDQHPTLPYVTVAEIWYEIAGRLVIVPPNFRFDGASIPLIVFVLRAMVPVVLCRWLYRKWSVRAVKSLFRPLNTSYRNLVAACFHDWIYELQPPEMPRAIADVAFEAVLVAEGEWWITARVMRIAVEIFGGVPWEEHRRVNARRKRVLDAAKEKRDD
jgi:hypothetical protein